MARKSKRSHPTGEDLAPFIAAFMEGEKPKVTRIAPREKTLREMRDALKARFDAGWSFGDLRAQLRSVGLPKYTQAEIEAAMYEHPWPPRKPKKPKAATANPGATSPAVNAPTAPAEPVPLVEVAQTEPPKKRGGLGGLFGS